MRIVQWIASIILLIELLLTAISAFAGLQIWLDRVHDLSRLTISRPVQWGIGLYTVMAGLAIVIGFSRPQAAVLGGLMSAAAAGVVLGQQLRHSDPLSTLGSYLVFVSSGVLLALAAALA